MAKHTAGVFPVFDNEFYISTNGRSKSTGEEKYSDCEFATVADMETFSVSIDTNVEEWSPMDTQGWTRRLATGKGFSISLNGKRHIADAGNDYVAGKRFATGTDLNSVFKWVMPDGTTIIVDCVLNLSSAGGDSTNVEGLEFEILSDGEPTVTEATE